MMTDDLLKKPDLMNIIMLVVQKSGIVGEEKPIKCLVLICCGKLVLNKKTTSSNIHPEDMTGAGKDAVVEHVMLLLFPKDWIKYNSPTPKAISYGQRKIGEDTGQKDANGNKILKYHTVDKPITSQNIVYIKDASDETLNDDDIKMLLEEAEVDCAKTINQLSIHLKWYKPVVIITTADTVTKNQIIRRLPSLPLNTTKEQTKKINEYQLNEACFDVDKDKLEDLQFIPDALEKLEPIYVSLEKVKDLIEQKKPKCEDVIMRTLFPRLLDYIKFSTALHQKQREKKEGHAVYYANEQDVDNGLDIFNYIYKDKLIDVSLLNKRQRNILMRLKEEVNDKSIAVPECKISAGIDITGIMKWKESEGASRPTLIHDMDEIMKVDANVQMVEGRCPTYYYQSWEL